MAAPAAPEVPAVGALVAAMGLALVWVASSGMLTVWRRSLGKLLIWLADQLDTVKFFGKHIFGFLSSRLRALEKTVDHWLGEAVEWSGKGATVLFRFFIDIQKWMAREIADLAADTYHALTGVTTTTVTKVTKVINHTVVKPINGKLKVITKTATVMPTLALKRIKTLEAKVVRLSRAVAHAGTVALPFPRIGALERKAKAQAARIGRLEKLLLGGVAVGAVWAALRRLGLGWTRCSNVTKTGKRVCGMDPDLLESLLGATLILAGTISLEQLARELQEPAELVTDAMHGLIREF